MNLVNTNAIYDFANQGFVYLCQDDQGGYWVRSVAGRWGQLTKLPLDTESLAKDLTEYLKTNQPVTDDDIINDNAGKTVNPPTKKESLNEKLP